MSGGAKICFHYFTAYLIIECDIPLHRTTEILSRERERDISDTAYSVLAQMTIYSLKVMHDNWQRLCSSSVFGGSRTCWRFGSWSCTQAHGHLIMGSRTHFYEPLAGTGTPACFVPGFFFFLFRTRSQIWSMDIHIKSPAHAQSLLPHLVGQK